MRIFSGATTIAVRATRPWGRHRSALVYGYYASWHESDPELPVALLRGYGARLQRHIGDRRLCKRGIEAIGDLDGHIWGNATGSTRLEDNIGGSVAINPAQTMTVGTIAIRKMS